MNEHFFHLDSGNPHSFGSSISLTVSSSYPFFFVSLSLKFGILYASVACFLLLFFNRSLLEYNCFTILLVPVVHQSESAICIHISPPS